MGSFCNVLCIMAWPVMGFREGAPCDKGAESGVDGFRAMYRSTSATPAIAGGQHPSTGRSVEVLSLS